MLTCTDDDSEWTMSQCCLCGALSAVVHCPKCGHDFCPRCKRDWFWRGMEAVRTKLGHSKLYCGGARHG